MLLSSSYEYPGRYTRWDLGFVDPPLVFSARERHFQVEALNARGGVLLPAIGRTLSGLDVLAAIDTRTTASMARCGRPRGASPRRSAAASPRCSPCCGPSSTCSSTTDDPHLGLYGAFGYDLAFQFEPVRLKLERPPISATSSSTCPTS